MSSSYALFSDASLSPFVLCSVSLSEQEEPLQKLRQWQSHGLGAQRSELRAGGTMTWWQPAGPWWLWFASSWHTDHVLAEG